MRLPQKEAKSKIEQDLVAREARGLKFAEQNEAAELESMNKGLTKREEVNTTTRQGMNASSHPPERGGQQDYKQTEFLRFRCSDEWERDFYSEAAESAGDAQPTHHSGF